jgi:hypothetical protein
LQQIFVPYFAYIWEDCAHNLTEIKELEAFSKKKRKTDEGDYALRQKTLNYTLHSLLLLLRYDKEEFITVAKFDKIYVPLVGQLSNILCTKKEAGNEMRGVGIDDILRALYLLLFFIDFSGTFNGRCFRIQRANV